MNETKKATDIYIYNFFHCSTFIHIVIFLCINLCIIHNLSIGLPNYWKEHLSFILVTFLVFVVTLSLGTINKKLLNSCDLSVQRHFHTVRSSVRIGSKIFARAVGDYSSKYLSVGSIDWRFLVYIQAASIFDTLKPPLQWLKNIFL